MVDSALAAAVRIRRGAGMNTYPSRSKTAIDTLRVFPVQISINLNDAAIYQIRSPHGHAQAD